MRILFALAMLFVALSLWGSRDTEAGRSERRYYAAIKNGDIAAACAAARRLAAVYSSSPDYEAMMLWRGRAAECEP